METYAYKMNTRWDIKLWSSLCVDMTTCPTYLAELVHRDASDIGYTYSLVKGAGGSGLTQMETALTFPGK